MNPAPVSAGDPEAVATRYRIHFKPSLKQAEDYERMMARMRAGFLSQGKDGTVKAGAVVGRRADQRVMRRLRSGK